MRAPMQPQLHSLGLEGAQRKTAGRANRTLCADARPFLSRSTTEITERTEKNEEKTGGGSLGERRR